MRRNGVAVDFLKGAGNSDAAVAGSLAGVLAGWLLLLLLLLLLCLAPGRATMSLACGPGYGTTTSGAPLGSRTLDVVNEGGENLSGAFRLIPSAGTETPAGITARAATAAVAAAVAATASHLAVTLVLQM